MGNTGAKWQWNPRSFRLTAATHILGGMQPKIKGTVMQGMYQATRRRSSQPMTRFGMRGRPGLRT